MEEHTSASASSRLAWHPAFSQAVKLELFDYRDFLEFSAEFPLTAEPLRIDLLVIKKPKDLVIEKNIARMFKSDNLLEYKSPEDYLSVRDFLKAYAYANLYASITRDVGMEDVTLTFIASRHPRQLMRYLTETRTCAITESSPGIYTIDGDFFPIQIIESKKLPESENLWLKSLKKDLEMRGMNAILEKRRKSRIAWNDIDAYMDVILRANPAIITEVHTMKAPTLETLLIENGWTHKWIEQGKAQGEAKGRQEGKAEGRREGKAEGEAKGKIEERQFVLELLNQGLSIDELKQRLARE